MNERLKKKKLKQKICEACGPYYMKPKHLRLGNLKYTYDHGGIYLKVEAYENKEQENTPE